jgi:hypothetical protein
MKSALSSFAIVSNSINAGIDSIDAFIPFVIRLFSIKSYSAISIEAICTDFGDEYGFLIPRHPMETILNRMRPKYITKDSKQILINRNAVQQHAQSIDFEHEGRKYSWLLEHFINFCQNFQTPVFVSRDEADILFVDFLKKHDGDIIFAAYFDEKISLLPDMPEVSDSDKVYLLNRYVNDLLKMGGEHAEYLIDSAVGHKYASLLLYREFSNVRGRGVCANYYLDVGILFDLTGINKAFRKKAAEDFLSMLRAKGSSVWVFRHTYEEFMRIVDGCLTWVESNSYNPSKANRTLQHFKEEGFGIAEVQLFISQVDDVLKNNKINKAPPLDPNVDQIHEIDREGLRSIILDVYNSSGRLFDIEDREETLEKDEVSIESIYKLRKGNVPTNLSDATHVFLTTNPGLAFASNKFEQLFLKRGYFTIPTVLTDTFAGTVVWVEEPTQLAKEFNKIKIITYTNAALQPRTNLMNKFVIEVEKAKRNEINPISVERAYLLLTSTLPRKLLVDKTLGDSNRITAQTPYEILAEFEKSLVAEEREKSKALLAEEQKKSNAAIIDAKVKGIGEEKAKQDLQSHREHTNKLIKTIATWVKWIVIGVLIILAFMLYSSTEFQEQITILLKYINIIVSVYLAVTGTTIILLGVAAEKLTSKVLTKILLPLPRK